MKIGNLITVLESCIETIRHLVRDPRDATLHDLARNEAEYTDRVEYRGTDENPKQTAKSIGNKRRRYIQDVEKEFGVSLLKLDKRTNELKPTPEAEAFIERLEELVFAYKSLQGLTNARVRISAIDSAVNFWIPHALANVFDAAEQSVDIECYTQEWWKVLGDLRTGFAEIGIGPQIRDESLHIEPLLTRPHVAVFSNKHMTLVEKGSLDAEDFQEFGAICLHAGSAPISLEQHLSHNAKRLIRVNTNSQAAAWAACGHGIAVLTRDTIPPGLPVEIRPLGFTVIDAVDCIYRRHEIDPTADALYDAILAYGKAWSAGKRE